MIWLSLFRIGEIVRDIFQIAILSSTNRLKMFDTLAAAKPRQDVGFLLLPILWDQDHDKFADNFFG